MEDLSSDDEDNVDRHAREARVSVNKTLVKAFLGVNPEFETLSIPVYSVKSKSVTYPPNSIIIDESDNIFLSREGSPASSVVSLGEPLIKVNNLHLKDMTAIQNLTTDPPQAIIFINVAPARIRLLFNFYKELTESKDGSLVTKEFRGAPLSLKLANNYKLYKLASVLGARSLLTAIQQGGDTFPERSMTRILMLTKEHVSNIKFMVYPRVYGCLFTPPSLSNFLLVDVTNLTTKWFTKPNTKFKTTLKRVMKDTFIKNKPTDSAGVYWMSKAVYVNLKRLHKEVSDPEMVVFVNVTPSAVNYMINFYENIVNHIEGKDTLGYDDCRLLKEASMEQVKQWWLQLASLCKATEFETALRRL